MSRYFRRKNTQRKKMKGDIATAEIYEEVSSRILGAIGNKRYKARTIAGIAKETHIRPNIVISTIKSNPELRENIKVYPRQTKSGELLLTTKKRFSSEASLKDKFVDVFSTHRLGLGNDK